MPIKDPVQMRAARTRYNRRIRNAWKSMGLTTRGEPFKRPGWRGKAIIQPEERSDEELDQMAAEWLSHGTSRNSGVFTIPISAMHGKGTQSGV